MLHEGSSDVASLQAQLAAAQEEASGLRNNSEEVEYLQAQLRRTLRQVVELQRQVSRRSYVCIATAGDFFVITCSATLPCCQWVVQNLSIFLLHDMGNPRHVLRFRVLVCVCLCRSSYCSRSAHLRPLQPILTRRQLLRRQLGQRLTS